MDLSGLTPRAVFRRVSLPYLEYVLPDGGYTIGAWLRQEWDREKSPGRARNAWKVVDALREVPDRHVQALAKAAGSYLRARGLERNDAPTSFEAMLARATANPDSPAGKILSAFTRAFAQEAPEPAGTEPQEAKTGRGKRRPPPTTPARRTKAASVHKKKVSPRGRKTPQR